jgi:hypothetical protein
MGNISIFYIGLGPKIQIFVEAGPARLPLFHFPAAQLEAQRARPARGLHPHGVEGAQAAARSPTCHRHHPNPMADSQSHRPRAENSEAVRPGKESASEGKEPKSKPKLHQEIPIPKS